MIGSRRSGAADQLPLRVLLVEERPGEDPSLTMALAAQGLSEWCVEHVVRLSAAFDRLSQDRFHAILVDLGAESAGAETVRLLCHRHPETAVVVVSDRDDEEASLEAIASGAQDYLLKRRANGPRLRDAVRFAIERQRAANALRERAWALERAQEVAHIGSWTLSPDTNWQVHTTREIARLFGLDESPSEPSAGDILRLVHPADRVAVESAARVALCGGAALALDHRVVRPDGSARWVHSQGEVVRDGAGRPVRMIGTVQDVTDRKKLEGQLAQSQKIEAVGRLAGGIAHDFNNILGAIMGFGQLLLRELEPNHKGRRRADEILKAANRAATLTRQLLAFSRKQVLQPRVVDLNAIAADMEAMLRRVIGEDVRLITAFDRELWPVKADPAQVEQVILNLAVNARDAMPSGGKLILETAKVDLDEQFARVHRGARSGPHVMLGVSDTGVGMSSETLSHIFEPFFTTKPKGMGTGLGLAMVYGIVKQSGGYIAVYSELGTGTSFKVYLPRVEGEVSLVTRFSQLAAPPTGSETVLLVEDDASLRDVVGETLEAAGYRVLAAGGPDEAFDLVEAYVEPIQILITDVIMPGSGGKPLADRLAASRPGMRVLFMSGYTDEAISHQGVLDPGTHFVQKPFTTDALLRLVRQILDEGLGRPTPPM